MIEGVQRDLIFDIGVNHGEDALFYLRKGFRVVGVEADPILAGELKQGLSGFIESGQFVLEPVGLMESEGSMPFYRNITCDHWSSFVPSYGMRDDTAFEIIDVKCVTLDHLLAKYGLPYYMKIDIEGADQIMLKQISGLMQRPTFISVEEFGRGTIDALAELGYDVFSLRTQLDKSWAVPPTPPREGKQVESEFTQRDSGLFGLEVPEWMTQSQAKAAYREKVRTDENDWLPPPGEWYDVHATRLDRMTDPEALMREGRPRQN